MTLETHSLSDMLVSARHASDKFRHGSRPAARIHRKPSLTFSGGAEASTGGRYVLETSRARVLVECGLFEGAGSSGSRNWSPAPPELHGLDAIVLTGAGLAQCGYLPALVAEGWRGPVFTTALTAELIPFALLDTARLLAEDAADANESGWSVHDPALAPFSEADAARVGKLLRPVDFGETVEIVDGVELEFGRSGYRPGSAWARLELDGRSAVFGAELGGADPQPRPACDVLVLETATERRNTGADHEVDYFAAAIHRAVHAGGSVLIPASAAEQTAAILKTLRRLADNSAIPDLPVYVDTPTGLDAVKVLRRNNSGDQTGLPARVIECRAAGQVQLIDPEIPSIVLAGSGTASYGRVLGHLARMLPDPRTVVVLLGCSPPETAARKLADGVRHLKIHGRYAPVRAEICHLDELDPGADARQLQTWATAGTPPRTAYVVHGDAGSAHELAKRLHADAGWCAVVPSDGERVLL
jgi:metallo-beta-lactamase family protein